MRQENAVTHRIVERYGNRHKNRSAEKRQVFYATRFSNKTTLFRELTACHYEIASRNCQSLRKLQ